MPAKKHTHKYYKMDLTGTLVWACALNDVCSHYMPKHLEHMVINRKSICWACKEEFILTPLLMQKSHPKCLECSGLANAIDAIELETDPFHALTKKYSDIADAMKSTANDIPDQIIYESPINNDEEKQ